MKTRNRIILVVLWALSLLMVAQWTGRAQGTQPGVEVRFLKSQGGIGNAAAGVLVANLGGQWLPVAVQSIPVESMPDGNRR